MFIYGFWNMFTANEIGESVEFTSEDWKTNMVPYMAAPISYLKELMELEKLCNLCTTDRFRRQTAS